MARKEREKPLEARMELERERTKRSRSADPFGGAWIVLPIAIMSLVLYWQIPKSPNTSFWFFNHSSLSRPSPTD
jgi:hypothetical protein